MIRLTEDLVEYMDCHPNDGSSGRLTRRFQKGKEKSATAADNTLEDVDFDYHEEESEEKETGLSKNNRRKNSFTDSSEPHEELPNEGEQTIARLTSFKRKSVDADVQADIPSQPSIHQAVESPVPEDGPQTCFIGILLPTGVRLRRRFLREDKIEVNLDVFVLSTI